MLPPDCISEWGDVGKERFDDFVCDLFRSQTVRIQEDMGGFLVSRDALPQKRFPAAGFTDSWRWQHPGEAKYSWWSYRMNARARNAGWRIDYFIVSDALRPAIVSTDILNDIFGSDHCPVELVLDL